VPPSHQILATPLIITVRAVATDCIVFRQSFFPYAQDNSLTAALSSRKFCTNMYLDNRTNAIDF